MSRKALYGLLVALALLAAGEGAMRVTVPREALLMEWERPNGLVATSEAGVLVSRPGMSQDLHDGPYPWKVRTNDLGLREDGPVPAGRPPGSLRILALGDSWMYGFSVTQGKTLADQVEALLPPRIGGRPVEVLNAGVFGSCAFDMLQRYRWFVDTWEIDGVLISQPHNVNRARRVADERARWYRTVAGKPAVDLRIYLWLRRMLAPLRAPLYAQPPQGVEHDAELGDLLSLVTDARGRGLDVWFVALPSDMPQALSTEGFQGDPAWRARLQAAGALTTGHALPERACWGFLDVGHPSEAGARVIAESITTLIAGGESHAAVSRTPSCTSVEEVGPGKPGWAWSR